MDKKDNYAENDCDSRNSGEGSNRDSDVRRKKKMTMVVEGGKVPVMFSCFNATELMVVVLPTKKE